MPAQFELSRRTLLRASAAALPIAMGPAARAQNLSGKLAFLVAEYSPKTRPFWQTQVAAFMAAHPGVAVTLESVNWQQMHDTTVQRIASGSLPDLVNTATIWLPEWVEADALQPVTDAIVSDALRRDMVPTLFEKGALYKGKSWGLPIAAAARGLFYNRKLLADAGITEVPAHWPAFHDAVVAIKAKTGQFGYGFDAKGVQAFRYFGFFLWNNGGDFFNADGTAAFNGKPGIEALQFLVGLAATQAIPGPTGTTVQDLEPIFKSGRLAMLVDGNYFVTRLRVDAPDIAFGVAPVPTSGAGVEPVVWGVTDTLVVAKTANQPIARAFIDHIYQTSVRTEFDGNEGFLPVLLSETALPRFADDPVLRDFTAMLPKARFDPLNPNYSKMQELVKTAMQQALTGRDAKAALDEAALTFNKLAAP